MPVPHLLHNHFQLNVLQSYALMNVDEYFCLKSCLLSLIFAGLVVSSPSGEVNRIGFDSMGYINNP